MARIISFFSSGVRGDLSSFACLSWDPSVQVSSLCYLFPSFRLSFYYVLLPISPSVWFLLFLPVLIDSSLISLLLPSFSSSCSSRFSLLLLLFFLGPISSSYSHALSVASALVARTKALAPASLRQGFSAITASIAAATLCSMAAISALISP